MPHMNILLYTTPKRRFFLFFFFFVFWGFFSFQFLGKKVCPSTFRHRATPLPTEQQSSRK